MGIGSADLHMLVRMKQEGHIPQGARVCEIGAQQLSNSFLASRSDIEVIRRLFEVKAPPPLPPPSRSNADAGTTELLDSAAPLARDFWVWLGCNYASIDIDGSPDSIPLDLNYDQVPKRSRGKHHLVTNFGTTEHVANQLNAFKVIHDLTAPDGLMMHTLPAQGMFNHGLVNYNPKFFWMLARSNGYKWLHVDFGHSRTLGGLPSNIVDQVAEFVPDVGERVRDYRVADCGLRVVLQKKFDIEYVAPLDVNTGTRTGNKAVKKRYWTVFEPNAFEQLEENMKNARASRNWRGLPRSLLRRLRQGIRRD